MPSAEDVAWHEKIARISLENDKDRKSPNDNRHGSMPTKG